MLKAARLHFSEPANTFISIPLLSHLTTVIQDRGHQIENASPCNHSNSIRECAGPQKWIYTLCTWRRESCVQKGCECESATNDTLQRLVLP